MGSMAEAIDIEFVVAAGDIHHFEGVQSTSDPLWMTNYELIYSHPDLMIPWYPVCGNHEYREVLQLHGRGGRHHDTPRDDRHLSPARQVPR